MQKIISFLGNLLTCRGYVRRTDTDTIKLAARTSDFAEYLSAFSIRNAVMLPLSIGPNATTQMHANRE